MGLTKGFGHRGEVSDPRWLAGSRVAGSRVAGFRVAGSRVAGFPLSALACQSLDVDQRLIFKDDAPRWVLAYNGAWIRTAHDAAFVDVELDIAIRYRADSRSHLFVASGLAGGRHAFVVDEGVFNGLERLGYLHTYTAQWRWRVPRSICRRRARG